MKNKASIADDRQGSALYRPCQAGVYKGRKKALSPEQVQALIAQDKANGGKNRAALARDTGISRETLYQYLREAGAAAA